MKNDNEVIAEFMGAVYRSGPDHFNPDRTIVQWIITGNPFNQHRDSTKHWYSPEQLLYNQSWDWVMPVVKRTFDTEFGGNFDEWRNKNRKICDALSLVDIDVVYNAVVDFIKWHNAQKV